jgi:hypothetical protein
MEEPKSNLLEVVSTEAFKRTVGRPLDILKGQGSSAHADLVDDVGEEFGPTIHPLGASIRALAKQMGEFTSGTGTRATIAQAAIVATLLWVNEAMRADNGEEPIQAILNRVLKGDE